MTNEEISLSEYTSLVGKQIGKSAWFPIDQERINLFGKVTEDEQFLHTDPDAAARTAFGGTIAHGFLTLSMLSAMAMSIIPDVRGTESRINYGMNNLRFVQPVRSGKRIRAIFDLVDCQERRPGQWQSTFNVTIEIEDEEKPALVAEWLSLMLMAP